MKTPNTTDQIFKEKLGGYASEVPAGLWNAIDNQRSPKTRGLLLFQRHEKWLALVILFAFTAYGAWLTAQHGGLEGTDKEQLAGEHVRDMTQKEGAIVFDENENETKAATENVKTETVENTTNNNSLNAEHLAVENLIEKTSKNSISKLISNAVSKQMPFVKSANIINQNAANRVGFENEFNSKIGARNGLEQAFTNTTDLTGISKSTPSDLTKKRGGNNNLNALESLKLSVLIFGKSDPCYAFNSYDSGKKGPPRFYIDVLAGLAYANRTLVDKNDDLAGYAAIRDSTETSRLGFSSTVRASLVLANGIALRSGVAYSQINEKLDLFDGTTTDIDIYEIKDVNGNIIGTQIDTIVGQRIKTTYNRLKMVDVPVILGYEVRDRDWTLSLNGGAYFNVLFEQKGEFLSPNLTPVNFTSTEEPHYEAFNSSVGMSLFGSVGLNYKVGNRLHVMAEPHFRYYMDSFTNANYPLKQNYWSVGMNVGVRVQIF
jgi:hypothetical protein